ADSGAKRYANQHIDPIANADANGLRADRGSAAGNQPRKRRTPENARWRGMNTLHTLLKVDPSHALMLRAVQWLDWGRTLIFDISAGDAGTFALRFDDCREMRWRIYAHETDGEATPIVDFAPGR